MYDLKFFHLISNIFTKITGYIIGIKLVAKYIHSIQICWGEKIISYQAEFLIKRLCLPNNYRNTIQLLVSIFLSYTSYKNIENSLAHTPISQKYIYKTMGIKEKDDNLAMPNNNNDNDLIYHNLNNKLDCIRKL